MVGSDASIIVFVCLQWRRDASRFNSVVSPCRCDAFIVNFVGLLWISDASIIAFVGL